MDNAVLENVSINYNVETGGVMTFPLKPNVKNYMKFVAIEDCQINLTSINASTGGADTSVDLKYSKDGLTWTQYDFNPIPLSSGETLYMKGNNENGLNAEPRICSFGDLSRLGIPMPSTPSTGKFECHGNIMSLLYGDDFEDKTTIPSVSCYMFMFFECTSLTAAPELPATTLTNSCYENMFQGCSSLTEAPELPATTLTDSCYKGMFGGCTSLTAAPELPATTLSSLCYNGMFSGCENLTTAPELSATTLESQCYSSMFSYCTSLTTAPELPATTLVQSCYQYMFKGCTNLNHITMLATDIPYMIADECMYTWVEGVASNGVFVKHPDMHTIENSPSGIPVGWTVENAVL